MCNKSVLITTTQYNLKCKASDTMKVGGEVSCGTKECNKVCKDDKGYSHQVGDRWDPLAYIPDHLTSVT